MKKMISLFVLLGLFANFSYAESALICPYPELKIAGPREVVYSYKNDRCADMDIPDTPTMAFKDASGNVHLFNGFSGSYMSIGTSLNDVKRDCSKPFTNEVKPEVNNTPNSFDNWKWFRSPWTADGIVVYGLIHNEFHGWDNPEKYCTSKKENACLFPSVTVAISRDGGATFNTVRDPDELPQLAFVAPYPYDKNAKKQGGVRAPTNIISRVQQGKRYYYLLANNRHASGSAQQSGTCLYRSDDISRSDHWRAWDGKGFNVRVNKTFYRDRIEVAKQSVCKPIFKVAPSSWTYNTMINQYIAVVGDHNPDGELVFAYMTSPDMLNWSAPKKLMETTFKAFHASKRGSGMAGQAYPSILDPTSAGLNFEFSGSHPYLYFTRFNPKEKGGNWHNRDVIRIPLNVSCVSFTHKNDNRGV